MTIQEREETREDFEFGFQGGLEGLDFDWLIEDYAVAGTLEYEAALQGWQTGRRTAVRFAEEGTFIGDEDNNGNMD